MLLGLIVEKASGMSFGVFAPNIFAPLKMMGTGFITATIGQMMANRAYGYSQRGDSFWRTDQA